VTAAVFPELQDCPEGRSLDRLRCLHRLVLFAFSPNSTSWRTASLLTIPSGDIFTALLMRTGGTQSS